MRGYGLEDALGDILIRDENGVGLVHAGFGNEDQGQALALTKDVRPNDAGFVALPESSCLQIAGAPSSRAAPIHLPAAPWESPA